jgi:hypothetical protein
MWYFSASSSKGTRRRLLGILSCLILLLYALCRQLSLFRYQLAHEVTTDTKSIQDYPFPHQSNGSFPISNPVKRNISQPRESSFRKKDNSFPASKQQHAEPQPRGVSFPPEKTDKPKHDDVVATSMLSTNTSTPQSTPKTEGNPFPAPKQQHVEPQPRGVSFPQENTDKPKHDDDVATSILSNNNTSTSQSTQNKTTEEGDDGPPPTRKWAYAFLIGGCSSKRPEYRGFLYNVAVAAQRFKELGSKADVVVFIQMSVATKETSLPEEDVNLLTAMDVRIHYLPKFRKKVNENFYALVLEKFRILELTEYSRVLFLDGDILPLCSLDYLFELSEPEHHDHDPDDAPVLKENVVLSWKNEAANAGFFMLQPSRSDYLELQDIIHKKEVNALALPYPHWDPVEGWGHRITPPDFWRSQGRVTGTNWTWHAVFADQGLLYHWTKYAKKSVSLIIGNDVENWTSRNGTTYLEKTMKGILNQYACAPSSSQKMKKKRGLSPYRDFKHFTGTLRLTTLFKLWLALVRF